MAVEVLHAGLSTTVQDRGRHGLYSLGMPPSGAMDDFSSRVANLLVGNDEAAAVLELTYMGPRLGFFDDAVVAVTGADMAPMVDGSARPAWEAFAIGAGETLGFDHLRDGARCYVAVAGGFDVPEVLGSRSTFARVSLGGHEGRALLKGDVLACASSPARPNGPAGTRLDEAERPRFPRELEVRIVLGLYSHRLTDASLAGFLETDWTVTPNADRVGYRYRGIELEFVERDEAPFGVGASPWNTCSLNYPCGVIQLPGGVEPIVLMKDGVTGGNYASVGTVITADLERVAQSQTHETTRFVSVSLDVALAARADRRQRLSRIRDTLRARRSAPPIRRNATGSSARVS
ncbi:MAG: hypothetical protein QOF04_2768 [Solirubrobacteraceae bacterium]|nr:hypothetical protein [Solirubrobacteraceae bacterium]